jgi:hypothetical protein
MCGSRSDLPSPGRRPGLHPYLRPLLPRPLNRKAG